MESGGVTAPPTSAGDTGGAGLLEAEAHEHRDHVVHRLAQAIYGLIVLVAVVGELRLHDDELTTAIAILAGCALVLVIAHSYSQLVASAPMRDGGLPLRVALPFLVDQLVLALPATIAVGILLLGRTDLISDETAYDIVVAGSLATLFASGLHRRRRQVVALLFGVANLVVGLVVIGVEAAAAH
jgi:hypothetical protein